VKDLNVPPPDAFSHSQTNGFGKGFLGCEPKSQRGGRVGSLEAELRFLVRKDSLDETIAPSLEHRFQTLDIHQINAHAEDHRRSA
jgi:hypothetical protein